MSYAVHNYRPRQVLTSKDMNEMDAQIEENARNIQTATGELENTVRITQQSLSDSEKSQARANIGLAFADAGGGVITVS